jgi:hypothetical protein
VTQSDFLKTVIGILEAQGLSYMIVGSIASASFGEARITNDIDIVVDLNQELAVRLCDAFPTECV